MANTYRKVYLHVVFAVKYRKALLHKSWRKELFAYMSKSLTNRGHYALAVNGYNDHVHLVFDYSCKELLEDLIREIKKSSNKLIKDKKWCTDPFAWQSGYGVFSVSYRDKDKIIKYVLNQEEHHARKNSFREEYMSLLETYDIDFKEEYVFHFFDDIY